MGRWRITDVRSFLIETVGAGGNYTSQPPGHWIVDERQANPLSVYPSRSDLRSGSRESVTGGVLVEIETADGTVGLATGTGGLSACSVIEQGLAGLLIGADSRDIARLWDQMYRSSLPYGRKGLALMAISVADLALWDLLGQLRDEPVYRLAGGATKERIASTARGPIRECSSADDTSAAKYPSPTARPMAAKALPRTSGRSPPTARRWGRAIP